MSHYHGAVGRPRKSSTETMRIPVDKIDAVSELLGRKIDSNQKPHINVRVPVDRIAEIREVIRSCSD